MNARQYIVKMMNGSGASREYNVNTSNEISAAVIAETVCDGWTASGRGRGTVRRRKRKARVTNCIIVA